MSSFFLNKIPKETLSQMAGLVARGYLNSAQQVLCGLSLPKTIKEKVQNIISHPNGNSAQEKDLDIKERVTAVLDTNQDCLEIKLPKDVMGIIFLYSIALGASKVLRCLSQEWYECQIPFRTSFQQYVKNGVITVIDAKAMGFVVNDEPPIDVVEVAHHCNRLAPYVLNGAGFSLITIPQGVSIEKCIDRTKKLHPFLMYLGINLIQPLRMDEEEDRKDHYSSAAASSSRVFITNGPFAATCSESFTFEKVKSIVEELGCEMPEIHEYFFQLNSLKSIFQRSILTDSFVWCSNGTIKKPFQTAICGCSEEDLVLAIQGRHPNECSNIGSAGVIRFNTASK